MTVTMRLKNGMPEMGFVVGSQKLTSRRRYRTMEAAANRLQKEAKGYLDSLRGWCWMLFECKWMRTLTRLPMCSYDRVTDAHCGDNRCFLR